MYEDDNEYTISDTKRRAAFRLYNLNGIINDDLKTLMRWRSHLPTLCNVKCVACNLLYGRATVKGVPCCGGRICRIKASKNVLKLPPAVRLATLIKTKIRRASRTIEMKQKQSSNYSAGQKNRYKKMTDNQRLYLKNMQHEGHMRRRAIFKKQTTNVPETTN
jgi:hypothetical protein